jgi:trk system potassium uptake protein
MNKKSKEELFVIIAGCGRFGSLLANQLSRDGHHVVIIDINENAFNNLSKDFSGYSIHGSATETALLKTTEIDNADVFIAATANDSVNIMSVQLARERFSVEKVIARVFDPLREDLYNALKIEIISPTSIAVEKLLDSILNED